MIHYIQRLVHMVQVDSLLHPQPLSKETVSVTIDLDVSPAKSSLLLSPAEQEPSIVIVNKSVHEQSSDSAVRQVSPEESISITIPTENIKV